MGRMSLCKNPDKPRKPNKIYYYYVAYSVTYDDGDCYNKSLVLAIPFYVGGFNSVKKLYNEVLQHEGKKGKIFIYGFTHLSTLKEE